MLQIFYKLKLVINIGLNHVVCGMKGNGLCIISEDIEVRCNCISLLLVCKGIFLAREFSGFSPAVEESAEVHTLTSF